MAADKILGLFDLVETALKEANGALKNVEESEDVLENLTAKYDEYWTSNIYGQQPKTCDTEEKKEHS